MSSKAIKRGIVISLLLIINLFLIYRYIALDQKYSKAHKVFGEERGYGYSEDELNKINNEYSDAIQQSLRLEFWMLIFFFVLVVYAIYVLVKSKLSYNDKKRIEERIGFIDLDKSKQDELLTKVYCAECADYTTMTFVEEKMLNGSMYVITACSNCNSEAKMKKSW